MVHHISADEESREKADIESNHLSSIYRLKVNIRNINKVLNMFKVNTLFKYSHC